MFKALFLLLLLISPFITFAHEPYFGTPPEGWYWGQVPSDEKREMASKNLPQTAAATLELIQKALNEAKAKAILEPTDENVWKYLVFQNWVQHQSAKFSTQAVDVVAVHPELNFTIANPPASGVRQVQLQQEHSVKEFHAKELALTKGLLFILSRREFS